MRDIIIVVDNAVMPKQKPSDISSSIDPSMPPLQRIKKMDLRRLRTARNVQRQRHQIMLSLQLCDSDEEDEEEIDTGFQTTTFPLSPLSRWDNSLSKTNSDDISPNTSARPGLYGKEVKKASMSVGWKSIAAPIMLSTSPCISYAKPTTSKQSLLDDFQSHRLTLVRAMPQVHSPCSASPVRMPVRKQSFDSLPRKPIRPGSPRSDTMSILDEALSVCDLCSEEINGKNKQVSHSRLGPIVSLFPTFDK
jgi:hypothetical protein